MLNCPENPTSCDRCQAFGKALIYPSREVPDATLAVLGPSSRGRQGTASTHQTLWRKDEALACNACYTSPSGLQPFSSFTAESQLRASPATAPLHSDLYTLAH